MDKQELVNRGLQSFANKDYERACMYFRKALESDTEFETAYHTLCESLNRLNKIDDALTYAVRWISVNSDNPLAHLTLSKLYTQKGYRQKALQEMMIYLQLKRVKKTN